MLNRTSRRLLSWGLIAPGLAAGLLTLGLGKAANAQTIVNPTWTNPYTVNGMEYGVLHTDATSMATDTLGNTFVSGYNEVSAQVYCVTACYNRTGGDWQANFPLSPTGASLGFAVAPDGQGGVATVGSNIINTGTMYQKRAALVIKYSPSTKSPFWVQDWYADPTGTGRSTNVDVASAVVQDAYGNVYVTGLVENNGTNDDIFVAKYASSNSSSPATPVWYATWDDGSNGNDTANGIAIDSTGTYVYVSGSKGNDAGVLLKYSTSTGQKIGETDTPGSGSQYIVVTGSASSENVYVANGFVSKYNSTPSNTTLVWPLTATIVESNNQVAVYTSNKVDKEVYEIYNDNQNNLVTSCLNPTTGAVVSGWPVSYPNTMANGLAVDNSSDSNVGDVYVTGSVYVMGSTSGTKGVVALKYVPSQPPTSPTFAKKFALGGSVVTDSVGIGLDGMDDAFLVANIPDSESGYSDINAFGFLGL